MSYAVITRSNILHISLQSECEPTNDTPYLVLTGELWDVFCEDFQKTIDRVITAVRCIFIRPGKGLLLILGAWLYYRKWLTHWGRDNMPAIFEDYIFKCIFLNENPRISIHISLKFVPKGPINNNPSLVQIIAWRRAGDKLLSEPMMSTSLTNICIIRPHWLRNHPHW